MIGPADRLALDSLYERYGFTRKEGNDEHLCVYYLRSGYVFGADVVPLQSGVETSKLADELRGSGFGVKIRNYSSIEQAHEQLFNGFFSAETQAARLEREHSTFVSRQTKALGTEYQYVQCRYSANDNDRPRGELINDVLAALRESGPKLVLVEAAAGFGKTCSAHEISRALSVAPSPRIPILAELSRNRQARIFKYVLLDEIDRCFRGLGYDLVRHEIQSGRIPLIVDGFDELLRAGDPAQGTASEEFESIETMLDTIGDLLVGNAKIVLTTRRTAVFSDDRFYEWLEAKRSAAHLTRITIKEPDVSDWIGSERLDALRQANIPIASLSNPVLLSHVRSLDRTSFARLCDDPDELVKSYFDGLLEREKQRQNLLLSTTSQFEIFKTVALRMAAADTLAAPRAQVASYILEGHSEDLEDSRRRYPLAERPAVEELAETLAGHALLDRAGKDSALVGFINDFVFGTLVGEALTALAPTDWPGTEPILARTVTAFKTRSADRRGALWNTLRFASEFLSPQDQLLFDLDLAGVSEREFGASNFERLVIQNAAIGSAPIVTSTFVRCTFIKCVFHLSNLRQVGFLECKFFDCTCELSSSELTSVWTQGSDDDGSGLLLAFESPLGQQVLENLPLAVEKQVLERFWARNRATPTTQKETKAFFVGVAQKHHRAISRAIESLTKRGLLTVVGSTVRLNESRLDEIRQIAGKE